jgi:hypothetical protein
MLKGMLLSNVQDIDYAIYSKTPVNLIEDGLVFETGLIENQTDHIIKINGSKYFKQRYKIKVQ